MEEDKPSPGVTAAVVVGVIFCGCLPLTLAAMGILGLGLYLTINGQDPYDPPRPPPRDTTFIDEDPLTPTDSAVIRDGSEPTLGGSRAEIEVVQFSDFQCQYCSTRFEELVELTQGSSWLRLQFKHYPLSDTCNPNLSFNMHEHACDAAKAADCAHEQGLFWPMATEMFANQDALAETDLSAKAAAVGLNMSQYRRCMNQGYTAGLQADIDSAAAMYIRGTPAIYAHVVASGRWYKLEGDILSELERLR